jgi:hypothetical protein
MEMARLLDLIMDSCSAAEDPAGKAKVNPGHGDA